MASRSLKVAVVQIESHPAVYLPSIVPMEEPFFSEAASLAELTLAGFQTAELDQTCLRTYTEWQAGRVHAILEFLSSIAPVPDLVVFPEYSIPWQCLPVLRNFSQSTGASVFAGTHTFQRTARARTTYLQIGLDVAALRRINQVAQKQLCPVLPVLGPNRVRLIPKRVSSPVERTEVTPMHEEAPEGLPIRVESGRVSLSVLPLVCAEALRLGGVKTAYDIAVVPSYQQRLEHFQPFIDSQCRNQHPVIYANDGRYGGSGVFTLNDAREANWLRDSGLGKGLPAGEEAILVMDVNLDSKAPEVGTADPAKLSKLVALSSITYSDKNREVSVGMSEARGIKDSQARAQFLKSLVSTHGAGTLHAMRTRHLAQMAERGIDDDAWWDALGRDCSYSAPSLRGVEAALAAEAKDKMTANLSQGASKGEAAALALMKFIAECEKVVGKGKAVGVTLASAPKAKGLGIIDRDDEVKFLIRFIDDPRLKLLEILGREQIGKSSVLEKALDQSALPPSVYRVIRISQDTTAEYIFSSLVAGHSPIASITGKDRIALHGLLQAAVDRYRLIIIEDAHNLFRNDSYREADLAEGMRELAKAVAISQGKLILLSRRAMSHELLDPSRCQRIWIQGFERDKFVEGRGFLNAQLRRVGLSPADMPDAEKDEIIKVLGGHPVALALAADRIFLESSEAVLRDVRERKGFWRTFIDRFISALELSSDEQVILRLLTGCRAPIAREVIQQCVPFVLGPTVGRLVGLCLVDVTPEGLIWLSGLFRGPWEFTDLPQGTQDALHRRAAEWYRDRAVQGNDLESLVEAEYHARLGSVTIDISSGLVDAQVSAAWQFFENQQYKLAKEIVDRLLARRRDVSLLRLSALIDCRCNEFDTALVKAREVFTHDPHDTWLLSEIAKAALTMGRDDITDDLLRVAKTAGIEDSRIALTRGRMLLRRDQLADALVAFESAKQQSTNDPWPYFYLGRTFLRMGKPKEAIEVLEEGQDFHYRKQCRNRRVLQAMEALLGQAYLLAGDDKAAEKYLTMLYNNSPDNAEIARGYAMLMIKKEGIQKAAEAFERLNAAQLRDRFDRCQFYLYYGLFLLHIGQTGAACQQFEKAHQADRLNVYVLMQWARALFDLAENAAAEGPWSGEEQVAPSLAAKCATLVQMILKIDRDNAAAIALRESLYATFKIEPNS